LSVQCPYQSEILSDMQRTGVLNGVRRVATPVKELAGGVAGVMEVLGVTDALVNVRDWMIAIGIASVVSAPPVFAAHEVGELIAKVVS
jgi:hypothetical protein